MAEGLNIKNIPSSLIAEQSLLGAILIDPDSLNDVAQIIHDTDFYLSEHEQIYKAMHDLFMLNKEIDVVTLIDRLVRNGVYDKAGGEAYIRTLAETVPSALNVKDYASIVKEKSVLRQLIEVSGEISDAAYASQDTATNIIGFAENKIYSIAQGRDTKGFIHISQSLQNVLAQLSELSKNPDAVHGTKTGFSGLDNVLAGMGNSDLIFVGARPGMGKTSFALNIGTNVAKQTKKTVCLFSLEMSSDQLVQRVLSSEALVDSNLLRTGKITPDDWDKLARATAVLSGCNILIDDSSGINITTMKAKLRRVNNLGLVIIDYLQLMQSDRKIDNRVQEVSEISRSMKLMAKELNVPVICCSQLSRGPESRTTNKRPMLSDLRESGSIEQDADMVLMLYRDEYYKNDGDLADQPIEAGNIAEVIIVKNRHGSTGTVKMGWVKQFTKFRTLANEDAGESN